MSTIIQCEWEIEVLCDALLTIASMDVHTQKGEKPIHEIMRIIAKEALQKIGEME